MAQYIDKSALVAEIKRRMDENRGKQTLPQYFGMIEEDLNILSFLNTLEVKEVDLEKELDFAKDAYYYFTSDERSSMKKFAKYFFELGIKAQKGEEYDRD